MKNIVKNSVIYQAMGFGFDFSGLSKDTTIKELENLLIDSVSEQVEYECEVSTSGQDPDTKVYHSKFVFEDSKDGLIKRMNLFYRVGKTDYNTF
jgi:hypothetical protein